MVLGSATALQVLRTLELDDEGDWVSREIGHWRSRMAQGSGPVRRHQPNALGAGRRQDAPEVMVGFGAADES